METDYGKENSKRKTDFCEVYLIKIPESGGAVLRDSIVVKNCLF